MARCEVWWAGIELARPWHIDLLNAAERARRERLRLAADRARFTLGAALVRLIIGQRTGQPAAAVPVDRTCPRCGEPHGRPTVADSGVRLSVSHSGDWVAVAVSETADVGVDVEQVSDVDLAMLAPSVLSVAEYASAATRDDFFRAWTRKEAVVKATGDGLSVPLAEVVIGESNDSTLTVITYPGRKPLAVQLVDLGQRDGHVAALAALTDVPVDVVELSAGELLGD